MTKAQYEQFVKLSEKMVAAALKKPNARTRKHESVHSVLPGQYHGEEYQRSGTVIVGECEYTVTVLAHRKEM